MEGFSLSERKDQGSSGPMDILSQGSEVSTELESIKQFNYLLEPKHCLRGISLSLFLFIPLNYQACQFYLFNISLTWTLTPCHPWSPCLNFSSVQSLSCVRLFATPWIAARQARPLCPSPTPRVYSNSCPLSRWCHPAISSSVVPFSSCPQSLPASGSFPMSQLFSSGGQSTEFELQHQPLQWTTRTDLL